MKTYIGCKIINAELANLAEFKKLKYNDKAIINEGDETTIGYIVVYPPIGDETERYTSWSPKKVFELAYRELHPSEIDLID